MWQLFSAHGLYSGSAYGEDPDIPRSEVPMMELDPVAVAGRARLEVIND
jgi:hypothetical protein